MNQITSLDSHNISFLRHAPVQVPALSKIQVNIHLALRALLYVYPARGSLKYHNFRLFHNLQGVMLSRGLFLRLGNRSPA